MTPNLPIEKRPLPPRFYRAMGVVLGSLEKALGITCRDFTQLASEKMDQPLTTGKRSRYFLHRLLCGICRRQEKRMRQINQLASATLQRAGADVKIKLDEAARERLRLRISQELKNCSQSES